MEFWPFPNENFKHKNLIAIKQKHKSKISMHKIWCLEQRNKEIVDIFGCIMMLRLSICSYRNHGTWNGYGKTKTNDLLYKMIVEFEIYRNLKYINAKHT